MRITWLGQAGLLFENGTHTILVDPYLTDSVAETEPQNHRRMAVDERFFDVRPDMILITHSHADHLDPDTLKHYLCRGGEHITVLAPYDAWKKARGIADGHNYVMLNRGSVWSQDGITVYAVRAEHSDLTAVGFIIDDGEKSYYICGDTLYNYDVIDDVTSLFDEGVDVMFVPVNGVGNNMNMNDAADFADDVGAKKVVPIHIGLFDDLSANDFPCERKVIPEIYKKIEL